jgi:hypothetical protein
MVSAGLVPATVVNDFIADLYVQVFSDLSKRSDIASPPCDIAWAFRKRRPPLAGPYFSLRVNTHDSRDGHLAAIQRG